MESKQVFWALKNAKGKMNDAFMELDIESMTSEEIDGFKIDLKVIAEMMKKYEPKVG
jgi:hypothetical protein